MQVLTCKTRNAWNYGRTTNPGRHDLLANFMAAFIFHWPFANPCKKGIIDHIFKDPSDSRITKTPNSKLLSCKWGDDGWPLLSGATPNLLLVRRLTTLTMKNWTRWGKLHLLIFGSTLSRSNYIFWFFGVCSVNFPWDFIWLLLLTSYMIVVVLLDSKPFLFKRCRKSMLIYLVITLKILYRIPIKNRKSSDMNFK